MEDYEQTPGISKVLVNQRVINEYTLYLTDTIISADQYIDHFATFKEAGPDDVIFLHLNSQGGSVSVGQMYIRHMRECVAPIIGFVGMDCASQCAAIAMQCDDLVTDEMSTMLIHSFSYGAQKDAVGVYKQATFNMKLNETWLNSNFTGMLTEEEREEVLKGADVLLDSAQIEERWAKIYELRHTDPESPEEYEALTVMNEMEDNFLKEVTKADLFKSKS